MVNKNVIRNLLAICLTTQFVGSAFADRMYEPPRRHEDPMPNPRMLQTIEATSLVALNMQTVRGMGMITDISASILNALRMPEVFSSNGARMINPHRVNTLMSSMTLFVSGGERSSVRIYINNRPLTMNPIQVSLKRSALQFDMNEYLSNLISVKIETNGVVYVDSVAISTTSTSGLPRVVNSPEDRAPIESPYNPTPSPAPVPVPILGTCELVSSQAGFGRRDTLISLMYNGTAIMNNESLQTVLSTAHTYVNTGYCQFTPSVCMIGGPVIVNGAQFSSSIILNNRVLTGTLNQRDAIEQIREMSSMGICSTPILR